MPNNHRSHSEPDTWNFISTLIRLGGDADPSTDRGARRLYAIGTMLATLPHIRWRHARAMRAASGWELRQLVRSIETRGDDARSERRALMLWRADGRARTPPLDRLFLAAVTLAKRHPQTRWALMAARVELLYRQADARLGKKRTRQRTGWEAFAFADAGVPPLPADERALEAWIHKLEPNQLRTGVARAYRCRRLIDNHPTADDRADFQGESKAWSRLGLPGAVPVVHPTGRSESQHFERVSRKRRAQLAGVDTETEVSTEVRPQGERRSPGTHMAHIDPRTGQIHQPTGGGFDSRVRQAITDLQTLAHRVRRSGVPGAVQDALFLEHLVDVVREIDTVSLRAVAAEMKRRGGPGSAEGIRRVLIRLRRHGGDLFAP